MHLTFLTSHRYFFSAFHLSTQHKSNSIITNMALHKSHRIQLCRVSSHLTKHLTLSE